MICMLKTVQIIYTFILPLFKWGMICEKLKKKKKVDLHTIATLKVHKKRSSKKAQNSL